jgi:hypothetical protein
LWAVLDRFGYKIAFEELNGAGIHRLENVITLDLSVHTFFDTSQLWLEPVETVGYFLLHVYWSFD